MAAPTWMQNFGDRLTGTDLSGRKAAAAAELQKKAAAKAAAEQAERDAAKKKVEAITFKNGGMVKMTPKSTPYKCGGKVK
jgi:hypothetical protein